MRNVMQRAVHLLIVVAIALHSAVQTAHGAEIQMEPPPFVVTMERPPDNGPPNTGTSYGDALESSRRNGLPLIVFVGEMDSANMKVRSFQRANTLTTNKFPGVTGSGIVVGTWHRKDFIRHDLPATATDAEIAAVIYPPVATNAQAIANYRAQSRNYGKCECLTTGEACRCKPASDCGRQPCAIHNPILNPNLTSTVPQPVSTTYKFAPSDQNCPPGSKN